MRNSNKSSFLYRFDILCCCCFFCFFFYCCCCCYYSCCCYAFTTTFTPTTKNNTPSSSSIGPRDKLLSSFYYLSSPSTTGGFITEKNCNYYYHHDHYHHHHHHHHRRRCRRKRMILKSSIIPSCRDDNNNNSNEDDDETEQEEKQQQQKDYYYHLNLNWEKLCQIDDLDPLLDAIQDQLLNSQVSWGDAISSSATTTAKVPDCVPAKLERYRRFCCTYYNDDNDDDEHDDAATDICHDGRFTVFGSRSLSTIISSSSTLHPDVVFSLDDYDDSLKFIRDVLSCPSDTTKYPKSTETVVFLPGPNIPHQQKTSSSSLFSSSSPELVEYYSKVLDGIGMAQLHCYTQIDLGDITISNKQQIIKLEGWLMQHGLLPHDSEIYGGTKSIVINATNRDYLQILLYYYYKNKKQQQQQRLRREEKIGRNDDDDHHHHPTTTASENKKAENSLFDDGLALTTIQKMIDAAVVLSTTIPTSSQQHLVLIAHSTSTILVAKAIKEWKQRILLKSNNGQKLTIEMIEQRLKQALTVITFGSVCYKFPNGPAYLHLAFSDDPLASKFGLVTAPTSSSSSSSSQHQDDDDNNESAGDSSIAGGGGGKDSIHIQAYSPYAFSSSSSSSSSSSTSSLDAHNMSLGGIQLLALLLRVNGTRSFRKLYELASTKIDVDINPKLFAITQSLTELTIPPNLEDELLPAMIRATTTITKTSSGDDNDDGSIFLMDDDEGDDDDDILPCEDEARAILEWQFGYDTYDEIVDKVTSSATATTTTTTSSNNISAANTAKQQQQQQQQQDQEEKYGAMVCCYDESGCELL